MSNLLIIGSGAIATELILQLPNHLKVVGIVCSERSLESVRLQYPTIQVVTSIDALERNTAPNFVIECAGHAGLKQHGLHVLARGWPLGIISTGALTDDAFYQMLQSASQKSGAKLHLLSGAIAGLDGLSAACEIHTSDSPVKVTYISTKPPQSWLGTHAENLVVLSELTERTVFFEGNARDAASLFPQNANVAASIALKGVGFEDTHVQLSADPNSTKNKHTILIQGAFGEISIEILGNPLPNNPKTSYLTALSVLNACKNLS